LQAGVEEILDALTTSQPDADDTIVMRVRCKGSPERIAALRQSLAEWIESVQCDVAEGTDDQEEAGVLIAFYPLATDR
jgi:hypothetical protein